MKQTVMMRITPKAKKTFKLGATTMDMSLIDYMDYIAGANLRIDKYKRLMSIENKV